MAAAAHPPIVMPPSTMAMSPPGPQRVMLWPYLAARRNHTANHVPAAAQVSKRAALLRPRLWSDMCQARVADASLRMACTPLVIHSFPVQDHVMDAFSLPC